MVVETFLLICKPEQSGKTFKMIELINKTIIDKIGCQTTVNIIFCDNSLLLTEQTSTRVKQEVKKLPGTNENCIIFSSSKNTETHTVNDVTSQIAIDGITNVICCTNYKRVTDCKEIIDRLNTGLKTKGQYNFTIWLDEADKFDKHIQNTFLPIVQETPNVKCVCLTATPAKLFEKYDFLNVVPFEYSTSRDYHGWKDNHIVHKEKMPGNSIAFTSCVLHDFKAEHDGIVPSGTKWYIPADRFKKSHDEMATTLNRHGFATFIVNGDGIKLRLPNGEEFQREKTKELNQLIQEMMVQYEVDKYPIALTGDVCIGRGVSITKENQFIFDYAILSKCKNKAEASQHSGRLKGNCKSWSNYKPTTVFTTKQFDDIVSEIEEGSRKVATLAYSKDPVQPSFISNKDFSNITQKTETTKQDNLNDPINLKSYILYPGDICSNDSASGVSVIHELVELAGVDDERGMNDSALKTRCREQIIQHLLEHTDIIGCMCDYDPDVIELFKKKIKNQNKKAKMSWRIVTNDKYSSYADKITSSALENKSFTHSHWFPTDGGLTVTVVSSNWQHRKQIPAGSLILSGCVTNPRSNRKATASSSTKPLNPFDTDYDIPDVHPSDNIFNMFPSSITSQSIREPFINSVVGTKRKAQFINN